jgi:hypothetical protein
MSPFNVLIMETTQLLGLRITQTRNRFGALFSRLKVLLVNKMQLKR